MHEFAKGDRVVVKRGRKVPVGITGTVKWEGPSDWGQRLGIQDDQDPQGELVFVAAKNCDAIEEGAEDAPEAQPESVKTPNMTTLNLAQDAVVRLSREVDTLRAALKAANERADRAEKQAQDGVVLAQKLSDNLKAESEGYEIAKARVLDLEKQVQALKLAPAPVPAKLDDSMIARIAKFCAGAVEDGVRAGLRAQLGGKAPEAPAPKADKVRPLDLDETPIPAPKAEGPKVVPVKSVFVERAEGLIEECTAHTYEGEDAWTNAEARMRFWARTAPDKGGYDKCDIKVTWQDGDTYTGRFDLCRNGEDNEGNFSVREHVLRGLRFASGAWRPAHMDQKTYDMILRRDPARTEETRRMLLAYFGEKAPEAPKVDKDGVEILSEEEKARRNKIADAQLAPKTEPRQPAPAQKLTRCPACKGFMIGKHTCPKKG